MTNEQRQTCKEFLQQRWSENAKAAELVAGAILHVRNTLNDQNFGEQDVVEVINHDLFDTRPRDRATGEVVVEHRPHTPLDD